MTVSNKTAFIGLSHLGLVSSTCWAKVSPPVIALDTNKKIISTLKRGVLSGYEPGLSQLFSRVRKNYQASSNFSKLKDCTLIFFSLDTPTDRPNDLKELKKLINAAIPHFTQDLTLVVLSQVPVGFTRELLTKIKGQRPELAFKLYHWMNTIIIGEAIDRFLKPERIILGKAKRGEKLSEALTRALKHFPSPVLEMSYESAELTKSAVNLYLASQITTANTLSDISEIVGADINEIIPALRLDRRIGRYAYLKPTLRISGGHLERELLRLKGLAKKYKVPPGIVNPIINLNEERLKWATKKLDTYLFSKLNTPKICIWGLSYKKGAQSTENAASVKIIEKLSQKSKLTAYDPMAEMPKDIHGYKRFKGKYKALRGADCLLILTDWDEFGKASIAKIKKLMKGQLIVDCAGILYGKRDKLKDFDYITMGVG